MSHFTLDQWSDFARNVAKPEMTAAMQQHLNEGCTACASAKKVMQRVAEMAGREAGYEPPPELVRSAKAMMAGADSSSVWAQTAEIMELVFDSLRQPAVQGVRAGSFTARQLLYQKDNCCIDIHLESSDPNRVNVIGQVLRTGASEPSVGSVLVEALSDGRSIGRTSTNSYGEFHLALVAPGALDLCFGFSSKQCVLVRVPPVESIPEPGTVVSGN
jgi:hypothetical protein